MMLLQKRVVCFGSPVRPNCSLILGILSMHPEMLANGFSQVTNVRYNTVLNSSIDNAKLNVFFILIFYSSLRAPSRPSNIDEQDTDNRDNSPSTNDDVPDDAAIKFDRKISVSDAEAQAKLNIEKDEKAGDNDDQQRDEKNAIPRDGSVDTIASKCSIRTIRFR